MNSEPLTPSASNSETLSIITSGGAVVFGTVYAQGDFIGRDKIIYQVAQPPPLDQATLDVALAKLASLPVDTIPSISSLPLSSQMPLSPNPLFVGREADLQTLAAALKWGTTVAVAAATGLGGIGKTQLAVAFAHHYGQFFVGGVYWLTCSDPAAIPAQIVTCGFAMPDLRADFGTFDLETQVRLVQAAWQSPLPRLLIFDNCEEPVVLEQWRPTTGGCRVLITSRRRNWDMALGVQTLPLDILPRIQSIELLRKFRPDLAANDADLNAIAEELGDLPLALHLAGSFLKRYQHAITPFQYLGQLRQPDRLNHRSLQSGDRSPTAHDQHMTRTFALSYERLDPIDPIHNLALALFARAACFAPGQIIPRHLLLASLELDSTDGSYQATDALQQLHDLGLIEVEDNGNLRLHPLLAHFAQQVDTELSATAQATVAATLLVEANRINGNGLPRPLLTWQAHLLYVTNAQKHKTDEQTLRLCSVLGFHLHNLGEFTTAKPYYELALTISESVLSEHHPTTALCYTNLGLLHKDLGEYPTAQHYLLHALSISEAVLGEQHVNTAQYCNNLGSLLHVIGKFSAAERYLKRALAINEAVLGANHIETARSYNNLGVLHADLGEYTVAKSYLERVLEISEIVLGSHHPTTAHSYNNLGTLHYIIGEYTAAKARYEQALNINEAVFGANHPDTARNYNNLGMLHADLEEYAVAKSYLERVLKISEIVLGSHHPTTAYSYNNLGSILQKMKDYTAAKAQYEQALNINEAVLGFKHPHTAHTYNNLGTLHQNIGEYTVAKAQYEQALNINEAVLGFKHPDTARIYNNLGTLHFTMGEYVAAKAYLKQALIISTAIFGPNHQQTQMARNNLIWLSLVIAVTPRLWFKSIHSQIMKLFRLLSNILSRKY